MIYSFSSLPEEKTEVGGKAYMLAMMTQMGIRVPEGFILDAKPSQEELATIYQTLGNQFCVAVRSSATGEDSKEHSFAGQNSTFLFIRTREDLVNAINNCFDSILKESSTTYRKHFLGSAKAVPMNVVIQQMIDAKYAGVFFTKDPRDEDKGWLLEYISGVGEDLVSGKKTPRQIHENSGSDDIKPEQVEEIVNVSRQLEAKYHQDFDIEWAIDDKGVVYLLQARPITAKNSISQIKKFGLEELERLKTQYSKDTTWDGQTFAELSINPSIFSTELWSDSFKKNAAFDKALQKIGYLGFRDMKEGESILDNVFGKNYVNLTRLAPLYFGPMPYSIEPLPRPHLKFHVSKINLKTILYTPKTVFKMVSAGLSVNTHRKEFINLASKDLISFSTVMDRPNDLSYYRSWSDDDLKGRLLKEMIVFTRDTLVWPYILISLTETTIQTLHSLLANIFNDQKAAELIRQWTGNGIRTETFEMARYFKKACAKPELRGMFLEKYGHRGPGELDLISKRWIELGEDAFYDLSVEDYEKGKNNHTFIDVEEEINQFKTFKKTLVLEEWRLLKELLELREKWKMAILKPFAHFRYILLEFGQRYELPSNDIFWLNAEEIIHFDKAAYASRIEERKLKSKLFKHFNFSAVTSIQEIENVLNNRQPQNDNLKGEGISPGLVKGEVLVINDPNKWKNIKWPANPIVVAESTDPGWTPIFIKAKGIIVSKGGVLSHCAIVAREMGIPAVSGIINCHNKFKGGENVWLDGNDGTIRII
ncbi:Phosphoenolpyruvate synthase/pyruvate phosphate dikinase [Hahella chejuensis KCTC 2396]|uniref:Phosphoenolpyruvate synthase/pyruvate phosphate dikinase n=1 Tax=Hahella chejuensis (strain KCTC 2396) TaxID=349521 RepID=Q2SB04_HAHCH|nr:PEP/pyruvate-binding domain-containing protein [Hahella chejuensis]ABC32170.1 Phosphoenolpyruvate synthase/pyruvate phosphate dikinase [Hahella chejuensis KCTC 2396]